MARILSGKDVSTAINMRIGDEVAALKAASVIPTLAIVRVGARKDDLSYENGAVKRFSSLGMNIERFIFEENVSESELISCIKGLNSNAGIHGVLIFRPLPSSIDEKRVCNALDPKKDVDGITDMSMSGIYSGSGIGYAPCTAQAVIELIKHYGICLSGKKAVIIGRSLVIGKPVAMLMLKENATVTICHTKTVNTQDICKSADLLVVSAGRARMITPEFVNSDSIVLDVGINWDESLCKLCGDVDFDSVEPICSAITPVPGGIGSITTSVLASHVVKAAKAQTM